MRSSHEWSRGTAQPMSSTQQAKYHAAAAGLAVALAGPAWAVPFNLGEVEGQVDSTLTLSAGWAAAAPDRDLIGVASGGRALAPSSDDGRLNFGRGETFSKRFTGEHAVELKYGSGGAFLRGRYWYDFELQDEQGLADGGRLPGARSAGGQLLDAFVYRDYRLGEQPGSVRLGRQVLHWGEGLFLDGGLDAINPRDAAALRRPGTELRDGLLPVGLLHVEQEVGDGVDAVRGGLCRVVGLGVQTAESRRTVRTVAQFAVLEPVSTFDGLDALRLLVDFVRPWSFFSERVPAARRLSPPFSPELRCRAP